MKIKLDWYNQKYLGGNERLTPADSVIQKLNRELMNGFYWEIDSENAELNLREATPKTVIEKVKTLVVKILTVMDAKETQISSTEKQIQMLLKWDTKN